MPLPTTPSPLLPSLAALALLTLLATPTVSQTASPKRGLVFTPSAAHPTDANIWTSASPNDLTWYYNYGPSPSPALSNSTMAFVPMLWGAPSSSSSTPSFLTTVQSQIAAGAPISHVLFLNEPDSPYSGGSDVPADLAAQTWLSQIEPLKALNVSLGGPAVTGSPSGFNWLQNFFTHCNGSCSVDFLPVHWYGNFEGLASHVGQVRGTYPNASVWITEFADADASLADSQTFYNESSRWLDGLDYVTHYSYFGAFRSSESNVGPDAAFLTQKGKLTDIGSWYLGGVATGNVPASSAAAPTARGFVFAGWGLLVVAAGVWALL